MCDESANRKARGKARAMGRLTVVLAHVLDLLFFGRDGACKLKECSTNDMSLKFVV